MKKLKIGQKVRVVECGTDNKSHLGRVGRIGYQQDEWGYWQVEIGNDYCGKAKVELVKKVVRKKKDLKILPSFLKQVICNHCKGELTIRNPKGFCDHLYFPDNCKECQKRAIEKVKPKKSKKKVKKCKHEFRQRFLSTQVGMMNAGYYCIYCLKIRYKYI